jgi:hypothetical protein
MLDQSGRRVGLMLKCIALALMLAVMASAASACRSGVWVGDCSGASPDGAGNCIPADHGPKAAQQAAFHHYGDQAEQVLCMNHGPFRYHGQHFHSYGCKAIRGGHLQNDEIYCVILHKGVALTTDEIAALPAMKKLCG